LLLPTSEQRNLNLKPEDSDMLKRFTAFPRMGVTLGTMMLLASCRLGSEATNEPVGITYEKYVLDNGLEVILHEDHSDPIVAVATLVHAGSNREKPGRTGFAHFFEHMSFNDSENVPRGANRKYIPELGGSRNGGTWSDGTVYYEVVPTDAFEKIMWIDSDRLGFMINTVTDAALEREKQVVKNEKRERTDNTPYGHTGEVIRRHLYPSDHPYHWTVIGSLPDLQAATLEDVKEFYERFYGANNATLVIAGDIDMARTKELVDYWFGEIPRGPDVEALPPMPVTLTHSYELFHEDNFATLPELRLVFPTVEEYNDDSYALQMLGEVLSGSKRAPLYNVIVEERKLAPGISTYQNGSELAGEFAFRVRASAGTDLDDVKAAIDEGLARFERDGFSDKELERVKVQLERQLFEGVSTVLNKAFQLAGYNEYVGDPGYIGVEAARVQAVTRADVMRVYERYIKGRHHVMTNFVPKGQVDLTVAGAQRVEVFDEPITSGDDNEEVSQGEEADYARTQTRHDRSEPALGAPPLLSMSPVWSEGLDNGLSVLGIYNDEVPLVAFDLTLKGGHWLDPLEKAGVARLLGELMLQGTRQRNPIELEEAINLLGASISIDTYPEEIRISATALARNFAQTVALVEEILLEPRWDEAEYERLQRELGTLLKGREASPRAISSLVFRRLLYGDDHIFGLPVSGNTETAARIGIDDLKAYYEAYVTPHLASVHVAGDVNQQEVLHALTGLGSRWQGGEVDMPSYTLPADDRSGQVYFIDVADAKQSVIRIGSLALSGKDDAFNELVYANDRLGGGSSSRMFQQMRIEKGWTYGAYSWVGQTLEVAPFTASSSVRSNVTLPSLQLMRQLLDDYGDTFGEDEMAVTKNMVIKINTRAFESLDAKLGVLRRISKYDLPVDFVEREQQELLAMELADFHRIIERYMKVDDMLYLVVGDGLTQLDEVAQLGPGMPIVLDIYGNPVD
jgi:zinc protease